MQSQIVRNLFSVLGLFLFLQVTSCSAAVYEPEYAVKLTNYTTFVMPPSVVSDKWITFISFYFDNGLEARDISYWKFKSQAKEKAGFKYAKNANLIGDYKFVGYNEFGRMEYKNFSFIEEGKDYSKSIDLYIDKNFTFKNLPKIASIQEKIEKIDHWFSTETFYHYEIRLTDGNSWKINKSESRREWLTKWGEGDEIIIIGNSKKICLINKTKASARKDFCIESVDYIDLSKAERI